MVEKIYFEIEKPLNPKINNQRQLRITTELAINFAKDMSAFWTMDMESY